MDKYRTILGYKILTQKEWQAIEDTMAFKDEKLREAQEQVRALELKLDKFVSLKSDLHKLAVHYGI